LQEPVVEDNVRLPDEAAGDADGVQAIVVLCLPGQVGVRPHLPVPQVGGQDLVPLVLRRVKMEPCLHVALDDIDRITHM